MGNVPTTKVPSLVCPALPIQNASGVVARYISIVPNPPRLDDVGHKSNGHGFGFVRP